MRLTFFALFTSFGLLTLAVPTTRHVVHERRDVHSRWVKRESLDSTFLLPMRIGLTQSNLHKGHDMLMDVSDPRSTNYGQYYSVDDIHDLFAPADEAVKVVNSWLQGAGIAANRISQSTNKQWIQFDAKTHEVEDLLKTSFHVYEDTTSGKTSVGCDEYHVPEHTKSHIDYITPGLKMLEISRDGDALRRRSFGGHFGPIKSPLPATPDLQASRGSLKYCQTFITPNCVYAMYNITEGTTSEPGNELGIFEETTQYLDHEDMDLFYAELYPTIPNGTFPLVNEIDGAVNVDEPERAGAEALLDFQMSYPIIYPQNSILYLTDSYSAAKDFKGGFFNTFLDAIDGSYCTYSAFGETGDDPSLDPVYPDPRWKHPEQCGVFKPTNVISFSYELAEFNEGTTPAYQMRQCNEYMKLGLQGVSLVFSSGDNGVASAWGCAGTRDQPVFNPYFPSNCPYVTSVGGTTLKGPAEEDSERAVTQFPSGGGFSNYFARPSYQDSAVEGYFASPEAPTFPYYNGSHYGDGYYNRSGRGFPDVAAIGQDVVNFGERQPYLIGGTSASAPLFAALLTRINEVRLGAGKPVVGFVNPTLYQNPDAFHDITEGGNPGCGTHGYSTAEGWDPVTGLGTPNYPKLLEAFMKD